MTIKAHNQKYIVKIIIPCPYSSIRSPNRKTIGIYNTLEEAKAANSAAILIRDEVIKNYIKHFQLKIN